MTITLREPFTPLLSVLAESRSQILALSSWECTGQLHAHHRLRAVMLTAFAAQSLAVKRFLKVLGRKTTSPQPAISLLAGQDPRARGKVVMRLCVQS
ncbi:hypothetical protein LZ023_36025 (plasmid) [Pseudomonas silvicola]|nr:hypothetical protein LZ023_36025 [Pseudomonas silvicola]